MHLQWHSIRQGILRGLQTKCAYNFFKVNILEVSRYIDDNRDIQIMKYRHRVNLGCGDIPVLAITMIFKMSRTLMITQHANSLLQRQYLVDLPGGTIVP